MTYSRRTGESNATSVSSPTVSRWTGWEAKQLRCSLRLTVNGFAAMLGVSPRTVNKWESRQTSITPLPEMQAVLDTALGQADEDVRERFRRATESVPVRPSNALGGITPIDRGTLPQLCASGTANGVVGGKVLTGTVNFHPRTDDAARAIMELTGSDMVTRRKFLELSLLTGTALTGPVQQWASEAAAAGWPTNLHPIREIDELRQAIALFRSWDASGVGGLHRKAVVGQLNSVAELLRDNRKSAVQRGLRHVTGELAQLTGWMTFDAGMYAPAQRYFVHALDVSREAGSADLAAKIVGDMAQLSRFLGRYEEGLAMLRVALDSMSTDANPLVRSELLGHLASVYAQMGRSEVVRARRAVDASVETFDQVAGDVRDTWNQYMDRAEVNCLAGNTYIALAEHAESPKLAGVYAEQAEKHVRDSLRTRDPHRPRSRLFDQLRLTKVRIAQREPTEAAAIAQDALAQAENMRSAKVVSRLIDVSRGLVPRYAKVSGVADFHHALREHVRATAPEREHELAA